MATLRKQRRPFPGGPFPESEGLNLGSSPQELPPDPTTLEEPPILPPLGQSRETPRERISEAPPLPVKSQQVSSTGAGTGAPPTERFGVGSPQTQPPIASKLRAPLVSPPLAREPGSPSMLEGSSMLAPSPVGPSLRRPGTLFGTMGGLRGGGLGLPGANLAGSEDITTLIRDLLRRR